MCVLLPGVWRRSALQSDGDVTSACCAAVCEVYVRVGLAQDRWTHFGASADGSHISERLQMIVTFRSVCRL
jgi:hypothetical protein